MTSQLAAQLNIVICTYNAEKYLRGCLLSVAAQQAQGIRVWVFDGGSTDTTLEILEEFNQLVYYFDSIPDKGVYDAMNRATRIISDGWILFLGADDRLMPNAVNRLRQAGLNLPTDTGVIYGDVYRPRANAVYDGKFSKWKLVRRNICQQALLYNPTLLKKFPFDIRFPINADHYLNLSLILSGVKFSYVPVCLTYFEDISEGISRDRGDSDFIPSRRRLIRQHGNWLLFLFASAIDAKQELRKKLRRFLGNQ